MAATQVILLQKEVKNITIDGSFSDRRTSVASLETVLKVQYKFNDAINAIKYNIHRDMYNIDESVDTQNINSLSGIYRGTLEREQFNFFQG